MIKSTSEWTYGDILEIRQIKYFIAIVDSGSVSRAAQRVHIAQSALSRQVSDLEAELKVQLLIRSRSGVVLTESGKVFYEYGQGILKQINDSKEAVRNAENVIVGSVVLGLPQSASIALALPLLNAAKAALPKVSFHINEELTGNLLDQLLQGRVDLALFTSNIPLPGFSFEPIAREDFYLVASAAAGRENLPATISLQQAFSTALLLSGKQHSHCVRMIIEAAAEAAGLPPPPIAAEVNSAHILKSAVEAGQGNTILPLALVADKVKQGKLKAFRIQPDQISRTLGIYTSNVIPATKATLAVSQLVKETMLELGRTGQWPSLHEIAEKAPAA